MNLNSLCFVTLMVWIDPRTFGDHNLDPKRAKTGLAKVEQQGQSTEECFGLPSKRSLQLCPEGLIRRGDLCYTVTFQSNDPLSCPYHDHLPSYNYIELLTAESYGRRFWVNARKNRSSSGLGHFQWTEPGMHYGSIIDHDLDNTVDANDRDCLVMKDGIFVPTNCSERNYVMCVYPVTYSTVDGCIRSHFDFEQGGLYCIQNLTGSRPNRADFCRNSGKLAEPTLPLQTNRLIELMRTDNRIVECWFGLENLSQNRYVWRSTNTSAAYNYWLDSADCRNPYGAVKVADEDEGWDLIEDGRSLDCAVCETELPTNGTASLKIKTETDQSGQFKLIVEVDNFLLLNTLGETSSVYCFCDCHKSLGPYFPRVVDVGEDGRRAVLAFEDLPLLTCYHWCKGLQIPNNRLVVSNTIIIHSPVDYVGRDYAFVTVINTRDTLNPLIDKLDDEALSAISNAFTSSGYSPLAVRVAKILDFDKGNRRMQLLIHITLSKTAVSITQEHWDVYEILQGIVDGDVLIVEISNFFSSAMCVETTTQTSEGVTLVWPNTRLGSTAIPSNRLCLNERINMLPVTRRCSGDFMHGARWDEVNGDCLKDTTYSRTTEDLFNLLQKENATAEETIQGLFQITREKNDVTAVDVHLIANILKKLLLLTDGNTANATMFMEVISNIMDFDRDELKLAQSLLNSTDEILFTLDEFLAMQPPLNLTSDKVLVQINDLNGTKLIGVALINEQGSKPDSFDSHRLVPLFSGTSFDEILNLKGLESALVFPEDEIELVDRRLISTMFYNDFLFNEETNVTRFFDSSIISTFIPGLGKEFKYPIRMAFRVNDAVKPGIIKNCSRWEYGIDNLTVSYRGRWVSESSSENANGTLLEICQFFHMTHFGLLLQGVAVESRHEVPLRILTAVGSGLSLTGVVPVFLTAICFKDWRLRAGNVILICISLTIFLQTVFFFCNYFFLDGSRTFCVAIGVGLHYTVLSEFFWMFVIAYLQYKRFVDVFRPTSPNLLKKCLVFGWGLPLLPVLIVLGMSRANYVENYATVAFCYPSGAYFNFGLLLPILVILSGNLGVFLVIFYNLSFKKPSRQIARNSKMEIMLALLLFFTLGLTWIFGLIGAIGGGVAFTYLFCSTATLRGFVLFLFFLVGNKSAKRMWKTRANQIFCMTVEMLGMDDKNSSCLVSTSH